MKKFLVLLAFLAGISAVNAEVLIFESNISPENYWSKTNVEVQKVQTVARKLIHDNGLKRAPITVERNWRVPNAYTNTYTKSILINTGMLPYITNDDELAFILGHELAHAQEAYGGAAKLISMSFNNKKYEYKSDLKSIDYMVKSGYNPIAGIIIGNKIFGEPLWDWGFTYTHPKGSKRLIKMYEYIYKRYPSYLESAITKNAAYVDFINENDKELSSFRQKQAKKNKSL